MTIVVSRMLDSQIDYINFKIHQEILHLFHETLEKRSQKVSKMALFVSDIRFKHSLVRGGNAKKLYRW